MAISVVTSATSTDLTTLSEVKTLLSITDTLSDALLTTLIAQATPAIENYIGYPLAQQTIDETIAGNGRQAIRLYRAPIVSITSVDFTGTDALTLASTDYVLQEPEAGIVFKKNVWTLTYNEYLYTFRYVYGYKLPNDTTPTLPLDIQQAVNLLVIASFNSAGVDLTVEQEKFPNVHEVTYGKSRGTNVINRYFSAEVKGLLDPYRDIRL